MSDFRFHILYLEFPVMSVMSMVLVFLCPFLVEGHSHGGGVPSMGGRIGMWTPSSTSTYHMQIKQRLLDRFRDPKEHLQDRGQTEGIKKGNFLKKGTSVCKLKWIC